MVLRAAKLRIKRGILKKIREKLKIICFLFW
nr:MAG TPA: hypothetical protein [Caudoviricetes sp.]